MVLLVGEKWVLLNPVSAQPQAEFAPKTDNNSTNALPFPFHDNFKESSWRQPPLVTYYVQCSVF